MTAFPLPPEHGLLIGLLFCLIALLLTFWALTGGASHGDEPDDGDLWP